MNEDDRNNLKKQVEDCKPMALIDEHTDEVRLFKVLQQSAILFL